jgi:hypothetical protein
MDRLESLRVGQVTIDANAPMQRSIEKILEMVQRLQASQIALINTLKEIPASDGETMLNPKRRNYFQAQLDKELESFGLK